MQLAAGLNSVAQLVGNGVEFRKMALRLFVKFAGEQISEHELAEMLQAGRKEREQPTED